MRVFIMREEKGFGKRIDFQIRALRVYKDAYANNALEYADRDILLEY